MNSDYLQVTRINLACLQELKELAAGNGNSDRYFKILAAFCDALEPQLMSMRRALEAQNTLEMAELVHSLKGSSASIGALRLSQLCSALENITLTTEPEAAAAILSQIAQESEFVAQVLERQHETQ